ncbi:unnamed protein product [Closterium sp. NIES-64]|nr:unnamed protein product [Closterium sp. NIES-64]
MDVWGPARVTGQDRERYFLLVVDDYSRCTTLREQFGTEFPVLRPHSDRGGEFASDLLQSFCCGEGIRQTFTLPASPQQNGVAESRIGLVMEVTRTSMVLAAAPHFLWPFAVRYAAHQLNLWPRVSLLKTSPTLRWTGEVGDASVFRVWGSRGFVRDTTADKLSACAVPCVFLGFVPYTPGWQFYHPTSRRVFPSQDVTFDESVPFYRLFPYRTAPLPLPPLFLTPGAPQVDPLPAPGPAPSGVSHVDPPSLTAPVEVTCNSGPAEGGPAQGAASGGAEPGGAEPGGARPRVAEPGGAKPGGADAGGAEPEREESGGAEPGGIESRGAAPGGAEASGEQSPWSGSVVAPLVPRRCNLVVGSLSPHSSCVSGTLTARVALLELGALLPEALELVTRLLELFLLKVLELLRVLALEILELLEVLALVAVELEVLELLRVLVLKLLELLRVLALEVQELLRVLALRVLSLLLRGLLGVAAFVRVCLSPHSSCTTGTVRIYDRGQFR